MRGRDGYRAVLAERGLRRLLAASLAGRIGFLMLPLGLIFLAGSPAVAGAMIAAFSVSSALAPARGRVVDRHGARALIAFAGASAAAAWALVAADTAGAPAVVAAALAGLIGLSAPPVGPFTRALYGRALRERGALLQRTYALDSAAEEAAFIVAPLLVALLAGAFSARAAVAFAAAAMFAGTTAVARSRLAARPGTASAPAARAPLPAALWLLYAALAATAATLGAIDIAVPAAAREHGRLSAAGILLAGMAVATAAGSLLAGRHRWRGAPQWRIVAFAAGLAAGAAVAATATGSLVTLAAALLLPGAALGALLASAYVLTDRLAPREAGTRTFAWLVTANNGGLAAGAAVAGTFADREGASAALWFGAGCAVLGLIPAVSAAVMSAREPK